MANKTFKELLEKQVGGTHYKKMNPQPWVFYRGFMSLDEWYGYLLGNIMDYLVRAKNKNGLEDLKKAQHLLDVLVATGEEIKAEDEAVFGDHNIPKVRRPVKKSRVFSRGFVAASGIKGEYCPLNFEHSLDNEDGAVCTVCGCIGLPEDEHDSTTSEK